ncbi:Peroxisomal acyl-coenzyme A oxidase 1 [Geodia barretti]|uniref:Acyl-coenzyme A oxidase n=1 Tax=Geodia barretti TaxID=519541 RepID=A0AA35R8E7_GEOBA|nr:Peroxisomal acyl-coenzyme A oxidase 1 [Geodia barretti]
MARYNVRDCWMVEELRKEREASQLDIEEITNFISGNEVLTARRREIYERVLSDPEFARDDRYFHSREEAFDEAARKAVHKIKLLKEMDIASQVDKYYFRGAVDEELPTQLNETMFIPTIESQGTEEQKKKWLEPAREYRIMGAYAQTELGHGTYLRGLETTATYRPETEEFVIHSPTQTSIKWWPGGLGHSSTHAVVPARLVTLGKDHGMHLFIVQLRSLEDHTPLPGINVGDIGPKFGYFGMDNGYLQLDNVRIPRDHMLMKYAQVAPDGTYSKPPTDKITYGTMVQVRTGLVLFTAHALARALVIGVRYSVVRRQGEIEPGAGEVQVMDYQTQQFKLLPLLASAYALSSTGVAMMMMFIQGSNLSVRGQIEEGNLDLLPELHATSAGLKAISAEISNNGIEVCRMACGGHGYSQASGLPHLYVNYVPANTYEGENTVLFLQTARYLNKLYSSGQPMSALPTNVCYLATDYPGHASCGVRSVNRLSDPHLQLEAFRQRARRMVGVASSAYQRALGRGLTQPQAWNSTTVDWTVAAKVFTFSVIYFITKNQKFVWLTVTTVVLKSFNDAIEAKGLSPANDVIMRKLCSLYAMYWMVQSSGEFMTDGYMTPYHISLARSLLYSLLAEVRKEAVPLVDAFDVPDEILNSALGRYDGDVYTHLYQWAQRAPRNKKKVHDVYHKYFKKLLKPKL